MYLLFVQATWYLKQRQKENGRESNDDIKEQTFKSLLMVRLNLSLDDIKSFKKTTAFVKERNPQFGV